MNLLYVLRQRRNLLAGVFVLVAGIVVLQAVFFGRHYTAYAVVSDFNARNRAGAPAKYVLDAYLGSLQSDALAHKVAATLTDADRAKLKAPYAPMFQWGAGRGEVEILLEGTRVQVADPLSIGFTHPDPAVAATVANALADEFVRECAATKDDRLKKTVGELQAKVTAEQDKITALEKKMTDLSNQFDLSNLSGTGDSVYELAVRDLTRQLTDLKTQMDALDLHRIQITKQIGDKKPLWDLDFIRAQSNIAQLYADAQAQANHVQELQQDGFQAEAPAMTEAQGRLEGAMRELDAAVDVAVHQFADQLQATQASYTQLSQRLDDAKAKNEQFEGARTVYDGYRKQLATENQVESKLEMTASDTETQFKLTDPNFAVLTRAVPPTLQDPLPWGRIALQAFGWGIGASLIALVGCAILRPPPKLEREEYERRRRRHRHFSSSSSSSRRSGSRSSSSSRSASDSSSSRHRN